MSLCVHQFHSHLIVLYSSKKWPCSFSNISINNSPYVHQLHSHLIFLYSSKNFGPAESWIAPSIPPSPVSFLFGEFTIAWTFNLVMSPWQREKFEFISLFTSNCNFCNDSRVLGQVTDHGLIMSKLTCWIVLKKYFVPLDH